MRRIFKKSLACVLAVMLCLGAVAGCLSVSAEDVIGTDGSKYTFKFHNDADAILTNVCPGQTRVRAHIQGANVAAGVQEGITLTIPEGFEISSIAAVGADTTIKESFYNEEDGILTVYAKTNAAGTHAIAVYLEILDTAEAGSYEFEVTVESASNSNDLISQGTLTYSLIVGDGHNAVTDPAVAPTCTTTGKTEGSHCAYCGEVLVAQEDVSATGEHVAVYTNNGDGTHTVTCETCDIYNETVDCTYGENNKCVCGAEEECAHDYEYEYTTSGTNYITKKICKGTCGYNEVISTIAKTTTKTYATILPENDLSLIYKFAKASVDNYTDLELEVVKEVYDKGATESYTKSFLLTEHTYALEGTVECEQFKFSNIAAYEVMNNVAVRLFGTNANGDRVFIREVASYSVYNYVKSTVNKTTTTEALKDALIDLLEYAGTTQVLLGFNTDNLANSETNLLPAWTEAGYGTPKSEYPTTGNGMANIASSVKNKTDVGSISFVMSLEPAEKVYLKYLINEKPSNLPAFTGDRNNLYFRFTYTAIDGKKYTETYSSESMKYDEENSKYYFLFDKAPIAMMDYPVDGVLYYGNPDAEGSIELSTITYSIESYIARNIASPNISADLKANLQAMFAYSRTNSVIAGVDRYVAE